MKKLLSVLISLSIIFSSMSSASALDLEFTKSLEEFTADVSAMIKEYDEVAAEEPVFFTADDETEVNEAYDTNRLIVKSSRKIDPLNSTNYASGYNDLYILQFEDDEACDAAMEYYSNLSCVEYVQEDGVFSESTITETAADFEEAAIGTSSQYQSDIFGYTNAKANMGSAPVTIAVVDTGVANDHEYLAGRVIPTGFDSVNNESCYDKRGHGTHVAGIIVANTKSNVKIKPYKVIGDDGTGTDTQLYLGIQAAIEDGVDIINLSLTRKGESEVVHEAVQNAYNAGITVVAAAGNDNANLAETFYTPACFDEVICVVSIDANKKRASTSNWRFEDTLSAPGVDILSSFINNTYKIMSGTSMAAPFISCCVAYLLATGNNYTPEAAYNTLYNNTQQGATASIHYVVPGELITVKNTCVTPVFTYSSGEFAGYLDVEITCDTPGSTIMYRTSDMNPNVYYEYTGPIHIEDDTTISAYAFCHNLKSSATATVNYTKSEIDGSLFELDDNGTLIGFSGSETVVDIPDCINGRSVLKVSSSAFSGNTTLRSITLGKFVTTIGEGSFKDCENLTTIYASAVTDVEAEAFSGCSSLETASITSAVTIGDKGFYGCSALTKLTLNKLTTIGERAFENSGIATFSATNLATINDYAFSGTPIKSASFSNVNTIGSNAFLNCKSLTSVTFSKATLIGDNCFVGCDNLTSVSFNALAVIPSSLFKDCTSLTSASFSVATEVGDYAFYGCSGITAFDFTNTTSIGDYAFSGTSLESILLPNTVTKFGEKAFYNCEDVKSLELTYSNTFDTLDFIGMPNIESIVVPRVSAFAFNGGSFAEVFPNIKAFDNNMGIDEIPDGFFDGCSRLESVLFRYYTYVIGANAFKGTALKEAVFEEARTLGENCFANISALETVDLSSANHIDFSIFSGSENVTSINVHNLLEFPEGFKCNELFPDIEYFNSACVANIPDYCFKDCDNLSSYAFIYTESIGAEAFCGTALSKVDCANVTSIGPGAFKDCENLGVVKLPSLTDIDLSAFENSEDTIYDLDLQGVSAITEEDADSFNFSKFIGLKSIDLSSLKVLPARAFKDCPLLETVKLDNCTKICEEAFAYCTSLVSMKLNNVTTIEKNAFLYCASLQNFEANSVTAFDFTTFDGCQSLKTLSFNSLLEVPVDETGKLNIKHLDNLESFSADKLEVVPDNFLKDCKKLATVSLEKATEIGDYAFYNTALSTFNFANVKKVGSYAFYNTELNAISSNSNSVITDVADYAFAECDSLTSVYLPNAVNIGESAFYGCNELTSIALPLVQTLPVSSISDCPNMSNIEIPLVSELPIETDGTTYVSNKPELISFTAEYITVIPDEYFINNPLLQDAVMYEVVHIGDRAFMNTDLRDIYSENIEYIGDYAFYGTELSVAPLYSATEIGNYAFANCQYLTSFVVYADFNEVKLGKAVCENDTALVRAAIYGNDIELPDFFFKNCSKLSRLYATDNWRGTAVQLADLKSLGKESFYGCTSMGFSKIKLSDIEYIGENACIGILSKLNGDDVMLSNLKYVDVGGFGNLNCRSLAVENAEVIKDLPECEYVVIGSDIKEFSCENTDTIICAYEDSVVDEFCKNNNLNFKNYNSTDAIYLDVDPVLTGYDYLLDFEAIGFNTTYEWYACNNPDRSDAVLIETTFADPKQIDPIKLFVEDYEENKYTYFFCVATSSENGNTLKIQSKLCKNLFATIKGTDNTLVDFIEEVIFTDSLDNINTLDNIFTVNGDIKVTPSYSTVGINCYGTGTIVDILNGDEIAMSETIIVLGDINGDAVIDVLDVAEIEKATNDIFIGVDSYESELAADVNRDEFIDVLDYQAAVNKALT